jgi:protein tyrosine/serine phosphatase
MTRELDWDGCWNVRDLGGIPLEQGGETTYGALVRGDNVRKLSDAGWRSLADHGVTRIVDLRWPEELARDPSREVGLEVVHVSLFGELDPDYVDNVEDYMAEDDPAGYWGAAYISILDEYAENFGAAVAAIADADDGVVLFHCAGGRDRTGLVAALVLRVAGASNEEIALDYSLSSERLARDPARSEKWASDPRDVFKSQTPPDAMLRALEYLDDAYGGAEAYLRQAGVSDEQLARLRDRLAAR